ncbi:Crp/Fnr family transcriptional regulator [Neolewinella aurantiaca]|nr:Crp/Fnr family transcriptional regulator [Neolewinella aurantiaca]
MKITVEHLRRNFPTIQEDPLLEDIARHGKFFSFEKDVTILTNQQYIDSVPLIIKGGVKVVRHTEDNKSLFLYFLNKGEMCPVSLVASTKRERSKVQVKTVAPTEIISLPPERVYFYTRRFSGWNEFTLEAFRMRFNAVLSAYEGMAFEPMEDRVMAYLKGISSICENDCLSITHDELAIDLGASRVGISRILKRLESNNVLNLARGEITLLDLQYS